MSALLEVPPDWAEPARRELLARSDQLLDEVEQLRLAERRRVPPTLQEAIQRLQLRIGSPERADPRTVRAAQLLVFTVQQRLMAANPRNPQPRAHLGRALGTPRVGRLPGGEAWKFLALPARPASHATPGSEADWREQVGLLVERAFDRWSLAQNQAVAAARGNGQAIRAVRQAQAAWTNYWELRCEAERLLAPPESRARSSAAVSGSAEAATRRATASRNAASLSSSSSAASPITAAAGRASPAARTRSNWAAKSSGRA